MTRNKKQGKLIVIDGTDGSGKATQVSLLMERLKNEGHTVRLLDFPEYYQNFFGGFIGECLSDASYNWLKIHPKIASVLYAADRWESKGKVEEWLKKGYVVIANRYVSSNQIHQGGKIKSTKQRHEFMKWLDTMEYKTFGIPRPNITIFLSVPIQLVLKMIDERNSTQDRAYLKKKKDVHESDKDFLVNSRNSALWLVKTQPNWVKIDCASTKAMFTREAIHEEIYTTVKKILK